ncbi:MAG TPA: heterodisulfide reductase-related iron-sulfur binding cluster [Acidimicrobiales bacterium]|nr:heterodisulfide reductase-related iron-sulfur binding cluster [Acidimicrobiales bacterium]
MHPRYFDESDLRGELERVYDLCHGCRLCFNLCPAFPSLFDMIDAHDGEVAAMTRAEQDRVVDECYQCKLCYLKCPYVPPHEWMLDFPRLMMRANAVKVRAGAGSRRDKVARHALAQTDLVGKVATSTGALANRAMATPGTFVRRAMEKSLGIAAERVLPPYARQRFSTWFRKRNPRVLDKHQGEVALFPTCFVEYMEPAIGKDLVAVYERNGVACSLPAGAKCCGAPWLHGGEVDAFVKQAVHNVKVLADEVRSGRDIVVAQPTCSYVLKKDYPIYVDSDDARLVAAHTFDAAEFLVRLHKGADTELDTTFEGDLPGTVTYHVPCHLQAQNIGLKSRDLMKLTGTKITVVNKCSGIDGTWGYRAENYDLSRLVARPLKAAIDAAGGDVICGDCHLANGAIVEETGRTPLHPMQVMARAYGIAAEDDRR